MNDARTARDARIVDRLGRLVGSGQVLADADLRAGFEQDWTGRYGGPCAAVVRPANTKEVAAVLADCNEHGVSVIPQAGNTGLVGGSVPRASTDRPVIVLSLRRLDAITDVDATAMQLTAGAGSSLASWQAAARGVGLDSPVDFAARGSATIGGAISTNAGGSRVLRFGTMRQQVVGVEAVLATGRVVGSMPGLAKETVGLHWPSLLAGSEGTLAVITAARLRLVPRFEHVVTAMVSTDTLEHAVALSSILRSRLTTLDALELIDPDAMDLVAGHLETTPPIEVTRTGTVLLVECAGHSDPAPLLLQALAATDGIVDSAIAVDGTRRDHLVQFRDRITESINAAPGGPPFKLDVAVPVGSVGLLLELARRSANADGARLVPFGHLAEGNLHLNYLGVTDPSAIAAAILPAVADLGGTISAEHGIGVAKNSWLHLVRSPDDLAAQGAIRLALDPNRILNPGVLDPTVQLP